MDPDRAMEVLIDAVRRAGEAVVQIARDGFTTAHKANQDPVTTADLAADRLLKDALLGAFPDTGWLSEETRDDSARLAKSRVWVVDPVDGTKEYVAGIPEYAVSVALIEQGRPTMAAVYNPPAEDMITAARGRGTRRNGEPVSVMTTAGNPLVVLASRSEIGRGEFKCFESVAQVRPCGSIAYKLALVAAGGAEATFSLGPKNEWDIAAGVLLVEEAGGRVGDKYGNGFTFNRPNTLVSSIVATTADRWEHIQQMIRPVVQQRDAARQ